MDSNLITGVQTPSNATHFPRSILDTEAAYGWVGDFVRLVEPHSEADPAAILTQSLVAYGNMIGRRAYFSIEADKHHLNMFMALVGQSAKGRKGTSWGYVRNMFHTVEGNWNENNVRNGLSSGEGLIKVLSSRKPCSEEEDNDDEDGTIDKRLLVQEGEFAAILQVLKRDGNNLSAIIRSLWDNGDAYILTRAEPLQISGAHVSIIGHITQDELKRLLSSNDAANGFANRFLWVYARRSKLLPEGGNIKDVNLYSIEQRLQRAVTFGSRANQIKRDDEAKELWREIYGELSAEHPGLLGSVTARAEAQTMRLACLYALLDTSLVVRKAHLEAAFSLWRYCFDSARYIFGNSIGDANANKIISALENAGSSGLTSTQISYVFGRNLSNEQIRLALDALVNAGRIRSKKEPSTYGRPKEIWHLVTELTAIVQEVGCVPTESPTLVSPQTSPTTSLSAHEENEDQRTNSLAYNLKDSDAQESFDVGYSPDSYNHDETESKNDYAYNSRPSDGHAEEAYI